MVRHEHPRVLPVAVAVELAEDCADGGAHRGAAEHALAVAFIEPALDRGGETLVIVALLRGRPRLGVPLQPSLAFIVPLREEAAGTESARRKVRK